MLEKLTSPNPELFWSGPIEAMASVMRIARSCPALYADDAFSVFNSANAGKTLDPCGLGCIRPPFPSLWIEAGDVGVLACHFRGDITGGEEELTLLSFHYSSDGGINGPISRSILALDADGRAARFKDTWTSESYIDAAKQAGQSVPPVPSNAAWCALFTATERPPAPAIRYYVLGIKPTRKTKANPPLLRSVMERKLHSVRGHRVVFTAERPAFGRLVGEFWVAPHRRGSARRGVIVKDYSIC